MAIFGESHTAAWRSDENALDISGDLSFAFVSQRFYQNYWDRLQSVYTPYFLRNPGDLMTLYTETQLPCNMWGMPQGATLPASCWAGLAAD